MQKVKYKVEGMNCKSCAALIEEKIKNQLGILKIRVNYESQKAVIVFDEQKTSAADIADTITQAGDFQLEEIEDVPEVGITAVPAERQRVDGRGAPRVGLGPVYAGAVPVQGSRHQFLMGFLISFSIFSLILNIILASSLSKSADAKTSNSNTNTTAQALNTNAAANQPSAPTVAAIQKFDITKDNHVRGDFNAPVTLVEFSDFECPYCEKLAPTLAKILDDYKGRVRLVYKDFPLSFHPNGQKAAEAGECASEQGKFWEYHDKLFANQPTGFSTDKFKQWANDLGLKTDQFNNCLDSGKYTQKVQADEQEGQQKGVQGTPATFVNGQLVSGAQPYEAFKQVIDAALAK